MTSDECPEIIFDNMKQTLPQLADPTPSLLRPLGGIVRSNGSLTLRGKMAQLFDGVDRDIKKFAQQLSAEETVLPASINFKALEQSDYLNRFPQFLNVISTLNMNSPHLSAFHHERQNYKFAQLLNEPEKACCSAVCLTSYPLFEEQVFSPSQTVTLTAMGRVFRRETLDVQNLERLSEFNMREIIFFGSADFIEDRLALCTEWLKTLLTECQLRGKIQSAEDPFFCPEGEALSFFQKAARSKFELLLQKPCGAKDVAVASINNHGPHFSKAYAIQFENGDFIHTGCFAVGMERLILLMVYQYGIDLHCWPKPLKARFNP